MSLYLQGRITADLSRRIDHRIHSMRCASHLLARFATKCARTSAAIFLGCMMSLGVTTADAQQGPARGPEQYVQLSYDQLDQLVAPIALYPDALVAQILAASTYSSQVIEANRFVQKNAGVMPPQALAREVDAQPWDASVKALTAFPSVLANLDRNIDWTNKLGNTYYNQPQDVMAAVQRMRQRAYAAGNLRSTPQETVIYQPANIVIQPANPTVVYVPTYNPWIVYGAPVPVYPAFYFAAVPVAPVSGFAVFGAVGFSSGFFVAGYSSYSWGFTHWTTSWSSGTIVYNHARYVSGSVTVVNRGFYGEYDHSAAAVAYNHQIAYGPNGIASRTVTRGNGQTNVTLTGPNGNTATRSTSHDQGGNSTTVTGPDGKTASRTVTGRGTGEVTATTTGPNGETATRSTSRYAGGNSTTVTGPDGQTAGRTVTGRGTGDVTATTTGPNGETATRSISRYADGNSTRITGPNGNTGSRTVTGRGTGNSTVTLSGPQGTGTRHR